MDLGAFMQIGIYESYVTSAFGEVPRLRGIRLMRLEKLVENPGCMQERIFNQFVGQDVVYIHTRCGGSASNHDSNYVCCGGKEFEDRNADNLILALNDEFDGTYRDHYLRAVVNDDYLALIEELEAKAVE